MEIGNLEFVKLKKSSLTIYQVIMFFLKKRLLKCFLKEKMDLVISCGTMVAQIQINAVLNIVSKETTKTGNLVFAIQK